MGRPPKKPEDKAKQISTYIHRNLVEELDDVANEEGRDRSELIRGIVIDSLERRRKEPSRWRRSIRDNQGYSKVNRLSTSQPTRTKAA